MSRAFQRGLSCRGRAAPPMAKASPMKVPPAPESASYRISRLNSSPLNPRIKSGTLKCELTGKPASVSLVTDYATLNFASDVTAKAAWEGILSRIIHVMSEDVLTTKMLAALMPLCCKQAASHIINRRFDLAMAAAGFALRFGKVLHGKASDELSPAYLLIAEAHLGLGNFEMAQEATVKARKATAEKARLSPPPQRLLPLSLSPQRSAPGRLGLSQWKSTPLPTKKAAMALSVLEVLATEEDVQMEEEEVVDDVEEEAPAVNLAVAFEEAVPVEETATAMVEEEMTQVVTEEVVAEVAAVPDEAAVVDDDTASLPDEVAAVEEAALTNISTETGEVVSQATEAAVSAIMEALDSAHPEGGGPVLEEEETEASGLPAMQLADESMTERVDTEEVGGAAEAEMYTGGVVGVEGAGETQVAAALGEVEEPKVEPSEAVDEAVVAHADEAEPPMVEEEAAADGVVTVVAEESTMVENATHAEEETVAAKAMTGQVVTEVSEEAPAHEEPARKSHEEKSKPKSSAVKKHKLKHKLKKASRTVPAVAAAMVANKDAGVVEVDAAVKDEGGLESGAVREGAAPAAIEPESAVEQPVSVEEGVTPAAVESEQAVAVVEGEAPDAAKLEAPADESTAVESGGVATQNAIAMATSVPPQPAVEAYEIGEGASAAMEEASAAAAAVKQTVEGLLEGGQAEQGAWASAEAMALAQAQMEAAAEVMELAQMVAMSESSGEPSSVSEMAAETSRQESVQLPNAPPCHVSS